jgi:threonine dehydrogenase-like Zn-dependent dehydrogenase
MRALVVSSRLIAGVEEVDAPIPRAHEVVVNVDRVGVCGTDVAAFTGELTFLHDGHAAYPLRLGHEWSGTVALVGRGVSEDWMGKRVVGDTMLGCGKCARCFSGRHYVCEDRYEVGVRNGWPGALAERMPLPVGALRVLPDNVDPIAGAFVEPGADALRAVDAAAVGAGSRLLVLGPGTIGLLAAQFGLAAGAEVHLLAPENDQRVVRLARSIGVERVWTRQSLPELAFDAIIDATNAAEMSRFALERVEPGGKIVCIGLAADASTIDTRDLVLKDVTATGILGGSLAIQRTIDSYSSGSVDPRPLLAATVSLEEAADVLAGWRPTAAGDGPKIQVDPRIR